MGRGGKGWKGGGNDLGMSHSEPGRAEPHKSHGLGKSRRRTWSDERARDEET